MNIYFWILFFNLFGVGYNANGKGDKKCQHCKLLTESFTYWLDKTSRGNFEGGDVAWEESNLGSYSRSEIRLVEIQENLCSELKKNRDDCYAFNENAEQYIEKWWHQDNNGGSKLYEWLCIDTLQHCCQKQHYGPNCSQCLLDEENHICSNHGACDGDGTRFGTGKCICKKGYSGELCDKCASNYYLSNNSEFVCSICHQSCDGCLGEGPHNCINCKQGFHFEKNLCVDENECAEPSVCKSKEFCLNEEGSYSCIACDVSCRTCSGMGSKNCTSCLTSSRLWANMCLKQTLLQDLLPQAQKKALFYTGLLFIIFIIFRSFRNVAALLSVFIAVLIYYLEQYSFISTFSILLIHFTS